MASARSTSISCDICGCTGQEVFVHSLHETPVAVTCVDTEECGKLSQLAGWMRTLADEARAQDCYEAGNSPWSV